MTATCLPNMYLKPDVQRRILNRLKRTEGQVRGVRRLISGHSFCDDVLIQIGAVKQAINGVAIDLLEGHMGTCVAEGVEKGRGTEALARLKGAVAHLLRQGT